MTRIYSIEKWILRWRSDLIWSLSEDGHDANDIAQLFNMEKSWISRIIKKKPAGFKSRLLPVIK